MIKPYLQDFAKALRLTLKSKIVLLIAVFFASGRLFQFATYYVFGQVLPTTYFVYIAIALFTLSLLESIFTVGWQATKFEFIKNYQDNKPIEPDLFLKNWPKYFKKLILPSLALLAVFAIFYLGYSFYCRPQEIKSISGQTYMSQPCRVESVSLAYIFSISALFTTFSLIYSTFLVALVEEQTTVILALKKATKFILSNPTTYIVIFILSLLPTFFIKSLPTFLTLNAVFILIFWKIVRSIYGLYFEIFILTFYTRTKHAKTKAQ